MKKLLAVFILLGFGTPCLAQSGSGSYLGVGIGHMTYTSFWFVNLSSTTVGDSYPIHNLNRTFLNLLYQRNGIFDLGPVRADLAAEFRAGTGKTSEDFLPLGETISEGGASLGLSLLLKFGYPIESGDLVFTPSLGLGPQIDLHYSNGEFPASNQFADSDAYAEGWLETLYGLAVQVEFAIAINKIVIMPSYRFFATGTGATDLEPDGREPQTEGVDLSAFAVTLAFSL